MVAGRAQEDLGIDKLLLKADGLAIGIAIMKINIDFSTILKIQQTHGPAALLLYLYLNSKFFHR